MAEQEKYTDPVIAIGTVAEKLGISISNIRKYEAEGLIIPHRVESGHRLFSLEDIERIRKIQEMIQDKGLNIEGIRRLQAFIPCWDIVKCSKSEQTNCPAFKDTTRPCWMIRELECPKKENECRNCTVYRFGTQCIEDIKQVVFEERKGKNIEETIKEIIRLRSSDSNKES
jgi:MerR family transcriptional regulator/heat shock protein HspR